MNRINEYVEGLKKQTEKTNRISKPFSLHNGGYDKTHIFDESSTQRWVRYERDLIEEARRRDHEYHVTHSGDSAYEKPYINSPSYENNLLLIATLH